MKKIIVCSCFMIFLTGVVYSQKGYGWKYFYQTQRDTNTLYYFYDTNDVRYDEQKFFVRILRVEEMNYDKSKAKYQIEEVIYNCRLIKFLPIKIILPIENDKYSYIEFNEEKKLNEYKDEEFTFDINFNEVSEKAFNLFCK